MDDIFVNEKEKEESEATPLDLNSDDLDIDEYFETVSTNLDELEVDSAFAKLFYDSYLSGDRVIYQKDIIETKVFDEEWIKTLESYFPSIDKITKIHIKYLKIFFIKEIIVIFFLSTYLFLLIFPIITLIIP